VSKRTDLRPPTPGARVIRPLADPPELTPQQKAQRKYKASAKGKAADARNKAKQRQKATYRAAENARFKRWRGANILHRRVYERTVRQRHRREARQAPLGAARGESRLP
jgi:hypothetical protein